MGPVCTAWMLNKRINVHLSLNVFKRAAFKNVFTYVNGQFTSKQTQTLGLLIHLMLLLPSLK